MAASCSMEGRVAVVSGAGRGLGRAYALLLAARGASVVVNDLGTDVGGEGSDVSIVQSTVDEILARGGKAVANAADVSSPEGAQSATDLAINAYGRLDAVINNAGIVGNKSFAETTLADFEHYWRVHVGGHINLTKSAWPIMSKQNYGRVVLTGSTGGLYGLRGQTPYAAAKGALQGLARVLALEGADHGILVNVVVPAGFSRMHEAAGLAPEQLAWAKAMQPPELVAPVVLWLSSDACQVTGQTFLAWGGRVARLAMGTGRGLIDRDLTPEKILEQIDVVSSLADFYEPRDVLDEFNKWMGELTPPR